ncbi:RusA family crossover junction endodeoxyribonuclease [Clostridium sp.]|uniref:RusA family crossover junction endodeoxyribonuclease n=1 Tax=Clostridium sp. TaxID=1506 RepID=UPI002611D43E|nr:RusA family crossover junction endodeoxyribonuclease [Clostridium sp.]
MSNYAKIVVPGSPITKSNFKLHNKDGRAILPSNSGKSYDKYALYEEEISYYAKIQNPDVVLDESLIAVLKVYYKSEKRHPDTANITKSIFDGIEKSGLIVNDAQIRTIITQEYYDKENPRFELEFFAESEYSMSYSLCKKEVSSEKRLYKSLKKDFLNLPKKSNISQKPNNITIDNNTTKIKICEFCNKDIIDGDLISANGGKTIICRKCFTKLF